MTTSVFCCGFECGISTNAHFSLVNTASFSTSTFRSGLRALRSNPIASTGYGQTPTFTGPYVIRCYVYFASLPLVSTEFISVNKAGGNAGAYFNSADSSIYAGTSILALGASGVAVTTGVWYCIDIKVVTSANPWLIDVRVNNVPCGQRSSAIAADIAATAILIGVISASITQDVFFDDFILSLTDGDYPLGPGYILSYIPNEDGDGVSANRHNGLAANEVERTLTGTDIVNTTIDAFELVNDRPLEATSTDYINWKTNGTAGDYVELAYENSVEPGPPRSVEAIVGYHDASGAGNENFSVTLRDSVGATTADIIAAANRNVGATMSWGRAHFATIPGGTAWTLTAFNALRSRFLATDASPDTFLDGLMLEAEYQPVLPQALYGRPFGQPGVRLIPQLLAT